MIVAIEHLYYTKDDYIERIIGVFDDADTALNVVKEFYAGIESLYEVNNDWEEDGPSLVYRTIDEEGVSIQIFLREFEINKLSYVPKF